LPIPYHHLLENRKVPYSPVERRYQPLNGAHMGKKGTKVLLDSAFGVINVESGKRLRGG